MRKILIPALLAIIGAYSGCSSRADAATAFLGTIVVPNNGSANNTNTGVPFTIPAGTPRIVCVIDSLAQGYNFRTGTGSSLAATTNDINQIGPATVQIPLAVGGSLAQVVAIFTSGAGGNVTVFSADGPLQSSTRPLVVASARE